MIKAVVFDMDGVLIEAKNWHYEALNKALGLFGLEISRYDHLTTFDGLPTQLKLEMLSVERGLPRELHKFINGMKQAYTLEFVHTQCKPRFVHEYALSQLRSKGFKLGVASNSIRSTINLMMKKAQLDAYLDVTLSAENVNRPKPDPEIYNNAIQRLGVLPEDALIIEDNENGIKAAKASGAHLLIVEDVNEVNLMNITNKISQYQNTMPT